MRILSVTLKTSERWPGDANAMTMKSYRSGDKIEVHLVDSALVVITRKGSDQAMAFPVSQTERIDLTAADAEALITEPARKPGR